MRNRLSPDVHIYLKFRSQMKIQSAVRVQRSDYAEAKAKAMVTGISLCGKDIQLQPEFQKDQAAN